MRRESFIGVGAQTTFSKIKTQAETDSDASYRNTLQPQNKSQVLEAQANSFTHLYKSVLTRLNLRRVIHGGLIAAVAALTLLGAINTQNPSSSSHARAAINSITTSASDDPATTLTAAATIAQSANSVIAVDVAQKASTANSQVALATAGDDFLEKKQPATTAGNPTRDITSYKIVGGDTLSTIAEKFNVTSDTIRWANNLADDALLQPGNDLVILPVSGVLYTVADGDTPDTIAAKFKANAAQIISFNDLNGDPLVAGTPMIVPDGVIQQTPASDPAPAPKLALPTTSLTFFTGGGNGYSFGYCTWYVASRRAIPSNWGNAYNWYYNAQISGFQVGSVPVPGAIAWEHGNHVAYVESVSGGEVTVSEMNYYGAAGGGWDRVDRRTTSASEFLYIY